MTISEYGNITPEREDGFTANAILHISGPVPPRDMLSLSGNGVATADTDFSPVGEVIPEDGIADFELLAPLPEEASYIPFDSDDCDDCDTNTDYTDDAADSSSSDKRNADGNLSLSDVFINQKDECEFFVTEACLRAFKRTPRKDCKTEGLQTDLKKHNTSVSLLYPEADEDDPSAMIEVVFDLDNPSVVSLLHKGKQKYMFVIEENVRHICILSSVLSVPIQITCIGEHVDNHLTEKGGSLRLAFSVESPVFPLTRINLLYRADLIKKRHVHGRQNNVKEI